MKQTKEEKIKELEEDLSNTLKVLKHIRRKYRPYKQKYDNLLSDFSEANQEIGKLKQEKYEVFEFIRIFRGWLVYNSQHTANKYRKCYKVMIGQLDSNFFNQFQKQLKKMGGK